MNIPEENKAMQLVCCELHNKHLHGFTEESDISVVNHYLVIHSVMCATSLDIQEMHKISKFHNKKYSKIFNLSDKPHDVIQNYSNIVLNKKYIQPNIAQCIYLKGGECVAILKTHWIRLIQRNWKRVFKERQNIQRLRAHPTQIRYREAHISWSKCCLNIPTLRGLLGGL